MSLNYKNKGKVCVYYIFSISYYNTAFEYFFFCKVSFSRRKKRTKIYIGKET